MVPGWNFWDNNSDTRDVYGHGTMVAGTAAACSNNGIGVASVAWNCKIMPLRVTNLDGQGSCSAMAKALTWAADRGARVANMSFGCPTKAWSARPPSTS
jgi:subtilisin family serine protease